MYIRPKPSTTVACQLPLLFISQEPSYRMGHNCNEKDQKVKISEQDLPVTFTVKLLGRKEARGLWGIKNTREPIDTMIAVAKEHNLSLPVVHLTITTEGIFISPSPINTRIFEKEETDYNANELPKKVPKVLFSTLKHSVIAFKAKANSKNSDLTPIITAAPKINVTVHKQKETNMKLLENLKASCSFGTFLGIDTISYGVQDLIFTRVFSMIVVSEGDAPSPFYCYGFICEDRLVARCLTYALSAAFQVYSRTIKATRPPVHRKKEKECKAKILSIDLRTLEEKKSGKKIIDSEA